MKHILGKKVGMTQIFAPDGATVAATLVRVPEHVITQVKSIEKDGYTSVQVGTDLIADDKKVAKRIAKPQRGHLKGAKVHARRLFEIRTTQKDAPATVGQVVKWDVFAPGDLIDVRGTSKGRGFAGVVKRHHFKGGPASHGHKDNLRAPGSIGSGHPQHTMPGRRMAGHMGDESVVVKNVEVLEVMPDERLVIVKGNVPGSLHAWVELHVTGRKATNAVHARKTIEASQPAKKGKEKK